MEVSSVKNWWARGSVVLVGLVLFATIAGAAASPWSTQCTQYRLGETIVFTVDQQKVFGWCCCCCTCPDTQILGWRVVDSSGQTVNSLEFDPAGFASDWDGTWSQLNYSGVPVPPGYYTLYLDTSVGTLSRCLKLYDPCTCCWGWSCYTCGQVATITHCRCRASLVLVKQESTCYSSRLCWPCWPRCP